VRFKLSSCARLGLGRWVQEGSERMQSWMPHAAGIACASVRVPSNLALRELLVARDLSSAPGYVRPVESRERRRERGGAGEQRAKHHSEETDGRVVACGTGGVEVRGRSV
jgi:hypothetical protein